MKPTIGRIVIYNHPGSSDGKYPQKSPAIIQNSPITGRFDCLYPKNTKNNIRSTARARARRKAAAPRRSADDELIERSLKRFQITADAENELREVSLDDLQFSIGESQWAPSIRAQRDVDGRPCLTVNRLPAFLRRYTGDERQTRPAMLVDPVGSGSDVETAEIMQGALRHIENVSVADVTYDTSYDFMLRTGWSYWSIVNEYVSDEPGDNDDAFAQEPRIQLIENPFSVYMSPVRRPDGTDPLWCHRDLGSLERRVQRSVSQIEDGQHRSLVRGGEQGAGLGRQERHPDRLVLVAGAANAHFVPAAGRHYLLQPGSSDRT